ncbi:hypothetical protein SY88_20740 [Clostridiales bacterium PH28_bin88]|nr:hypothetical protein SY88_20740 [Clostridiales bacterium PH28_bin88]
MKRVLFSIGILVLVLFLVSCGGPKSLNENLTAQENQSEGYVASAENRENTPTTSSDSEKGDTPENTERKQALEAASMFQPDITGSFTFDPAAQEVNGWIVTDPQVTIRYSTSGEPISDTGTSAQRGGIIVSVEQQKEIGRNTPTGPSGPPIPR